MNYKALVLSFLLLGVCSARAEHKFYFGAGGADVLQIDQLDTKTINVTSNINGSRTAAITNVTSLHVYGTNTTDTGNVPQPNYVMVDSPTNADSAFVLSAGGVPGWAWQLYRSELGEFTYLYNYQRNFEPLVISEGGRVGVNKQSNILDYHAHWLNPTGDTVYDDIAVGGTYTRPQQRSYEITIVTAGSPDKWRYRSSLDGGATWTEYLGTNNCSTGAVVMENGLTIAFDNTTGHSTNDGWTFTAYSQLPQGSMTVAPTKFTEVLTTTNNSADLPVWRDVTHDASTIEGNPINVSGGTNTFTYVGSKGKFNSCYIMVITPATNVTTVSEYYNGSTWVALMATDNYYGEGTANLTVSGKRYWDKSTMPLWSLYRPPGQGSGYNLYWIRFHSSTPSGGAQISQMAPQTDKRFAVYAAHLDANPSFYIDARGLTYNKRAYRTETNNIYGPSEYVTESHLNSTVAALVSQVWYLQTNYNSAVSNREMYQTAARSAWALTNSLASGINLTQTFVATNQIGTTNIPANTTWNVDLYVSKSSAANPVDLSVQLLEIGVGITNVLKSSTTSTMAAVTSIGMYPFALTVPTNQPSGTTNYLGLRVLGNRTGGAVSLIVYGGPANPSAMLYPAAGITGTTETDPIAMAAGFITTINADARYAPLSHTSLIGPAAHGLADSSTTAVSTIRSGLATGTPLYVEAQLTNWLGTNTYLKATNDLASTNWVLGRGYITSAVPSNWAAYAASGNVNMGGYSVTNVGTNSFTFSDGNRISSSNVTAWKAGETGYLTKVSAAGQYATGTPVYVETEPLFTAVSNDLARLAEENVFTGISNRFNAVHAGSVHATTVRADSNLDAASITLGGVTRTNWPGGGEGADTNNLTVRHLTVLGTNAPTLVAVVTTNVGGPNGWRALEGFTPAVENAGYATMGGYAWLLGGDDQYATSGRTMVLKFDGTNWSSGTTFDYDVTAPAMCVWSNVFAVIGGRNNMGAMNAVYNYPGGASVSLPGGVAIYGAGAACIGDTRYVIGGQAPSLPSTTVRCLNSTGDWDTTPIASLPDAQAAHTVGIINGNIYSIGGYNGSWATVNAIYKFDGASWTTESATLPTARAQIASAVIGTNMYIAGGSATNVYVWNGSTCTEIIGLPGGYAPAFPMVVPSVGSNSIYVISGGGGGGWWTNVYEMTYGAGKIVTNYVMSYPAETLQVWKDGGTGTVVELKNTGLVVNGAVSNIRKLGNTTTTPGSVYQLNGTAWKLVNCTNVATASRMCGLAIGDNSTTNGMLVHGEADITGTVLAIGAPIFISDNAAGWSQTMPTNSGYVIRGLGYAITTNTVYFNPDVVWGAIP